VKAKESSRIVIAANNGDLGGGEVMLLALADALTALGITVAVVGPSSPAGLVDSARDRGFDTVILDANTRVEYLRALRKWDGRHRDGVLWCNGLLPAVATAGHRNRIVHLHQRPRGKQRYLAPVARWGSMTTLVPSRDMATAVRGSSVLHNWVEPIQEATVTPSPRGPAEPIRLGFLGRPSTDKGVEILAEAVRILDRESPGQYRLVLAGESRFVSDTSRNAVQTALASLGHLVERTGWIPPEDFFGRVDVLVCPSIWAEPFGLVVAESMSARVPVVVSDAGALPEVVGPEHPWIAMTGDAEDLARVVRQAADGDAAAVERAYRRWRSLFSPEAGRQRVRSLLDSLGLSIASQEKAKP
jgi:glycosyltransferase involved in cell wall biosynthesis